MFAKDPSYEPVPGYQRARAYRASHSERYEGEKRRNAARQRALVRLSRAHKDEFKALYTEELMVAGLCDCPCHQAVQPGLVPCPQCATDGGPWPPV